MKLLLVFLVSAVSLCSACASIDVGKDFSESDFSWIEKGKTTFQEVVERVGKPTSVQPWVQGQRKAIWLHTESTGNALNLSLINPFNTAVNASGSTETADVYFRISDGVVVDWDYLGSDLAPAHSAGSGGNP